MELNVGPCIISAYLQLYRQITSKTEGNQRKSGTPGKEKLVSKVRTGSDFPFPKLGLSESFAEDPLVYGPLDKWGKSWQLA